MPTGVTVDASNTVLVSGSDVAGSALAVLDAVSGGELWSCDIPIHQVGNSFYFSGIITPADGVMYAHAGAKRIYALGPP